MTRAGTLSLRCQQGPLRPHPGNHLDRIVCDPDTRISVVKAVRAGSSGHTLSGGSYARLETTGREISSATRLGAADELPTWARVRALAEAAPVDVRGELAEVTRLRGVHERPNLRFTGSAGTQNCSCAPASGPVTPAQAKYATGYQAWIQGVTQKTWNQRNQELAADLVVLRDRVLPVAEPAVDEPVDLLEMLEQPSPHIAAAAVEHRGVADREVDQGLSIRARVRVNSP